MPYISLLGFFSIICRVLSFNFILIQSILNISPQHIWQYCSYYLLQGAILLGIPLLGVQADNDSLTQEEGCPHDYVPDRTFPLVMQNKVEHHCKRVTKEDKCMSYTQTQLMIFALPPKGERVLFSVRLVVSLFVCMLATSLEIFSSNMVERCAMHRPLNHLIQLWVIIRWKLLPWQPKN